MSRDVFVCHSTDDRKVANALVGHLEAHQIHCWIAPRDIMAGADYADAIVDGISQAKALLLVFSEHANRSPHVAREVERAVAHGIAIIPYRIEDVAPAPSLAYFLGGARWVDATAGDPAGQAADLARLIGRQILHRTAESPRDATREILRELIERYGTGLADDPRRLQALLRDVAGEHRAEVAVLFAAAEEGVGAALLQSSEGMALETGDRLADRLQHNRALTEDAAHWAVAAWMYGLGIDQPAPQTPAAAIEDPGETVAPRPAPPPEPAAPRPAETVGVTLGPGRPPATPPPARAYRTSSGRRRALAFAGAAAAVVVLVGAVALWMGSQGSPDVVAFSANEVFLEPANIVDHPFTSSLLTGDSTTAPLPPTTLMVEGAVEVVLVEGSHELNYAGEPGSAACDTGILLAELNADPEVARAWATAQGIDLTAIAGFVAGLTPVTLTEDARVTTHVLDQGQAVPRQALLERGTAVLAGATGEPRVRCASGSPLDLPVTVATPTYVGTAWQGFDPARAVEIKPCDEPITEFVLRDAATGEPFVRQIGSNVLADAAVTTTTVPPTTTTTTVPPTTTTTTTLPTADHDATREGTVSASSRLCGSYSASKAADGDVTTSWISSSGDGAVSTFEWTGTVDEFIGVVEVVSNAANATVSRRTDHGFALVTVQVLDAAGNTIFEEVVELPGTPDPDVEVYPNVVGRTVRLLLEGRENASGSGFAELRVLVAR